VVSIGVIVVVMKQTVAVPVNILVLMVVSLMKAVMILNGGVMFLDPIVENIPMVPASTGMIVLLVMKQTMAVPVNIILNTLVKLMKAVMILNGGVMFGEPVVENMMKMKTCGGMIVLLKKNSVLKAVQCHG